MITTSHDAFTRYIFHPMLLSPMGMMNTNTSLRTSVRERASGRGGTHARPFSATDENASPLARIE
jgi:hypothetical protein